MARESEGQRIHLMLERFESNVAEAIARGIPEHTATRLASAEILNWLGFMGREFREFLDEFAPRGGFLP